MRNKPGCHAATCAMLYALLICPGYAGATGDDGFISAIRAMKRSVVPIICIRQTSATTMSPVVDGTAFFVAARGDFITAAHVVADFTTQDKPLFGCTMAAFFRQEADSTGHYAATEFRVSPDKCVVDMPHDLALCRTLDDLRTAYNGNFKPIPVRVDSSVREAGTPIAVIGFPLFNSLPIASRGYIGGFQEVGPGETNLVIDRAAWPGNSGGPVIDSRGQVIGMMVQAGEGIASGISFAKSGHTISTFLAANRVQSR
jgi:S1-C subfamily serine protease